MFSTFTGNSRRPRNVNLSGQTGNPFTNTSWSPSLVSNATKTVSNAQADRERRQADKQRLRAAGQIQKTWRGHRTRQALGNDRRAEFDALYSPNSIDGEASLATERLSLAFALLVSFFSTRRKDDLHRLVWFSRNAARVDVPLLLSPGAHPSRILHLVRILVSALQPVAKHRSATDVFILVDLILRTADSFPNSIPLMCHGYFAGLAELCRGAAPVEETDAILRAITRPLQLGSLHAHESIIYEAFAFQLLSKELLPILDSIIESLAGVLDMERLSTAVIQGYAGNAAQQMTTDESIWLVARFVHIGRKSLGSSKKLDYLGALYTQLTALSNEIGLRMGLPEREEQEQGKSSRIRGPQPLDPYVSTQLLSLVETEGIASILRDFSACLAVTSDEEFRGTSILAGLFLTIMTCFPAQADATRMKLFLEQVPTPTGNIPLVQIMWRTMSRTPTFGKLARGQDDTSEVLRNYVHSSTSVPQVDEQDWRVILLFLELYTFVLRLSDDEEFLHGLSTELLQQDPMTMSRIQACSLTMDQVKQLTMVLKHTAFSLYSNGPEFFQTQARLQDKRAKSSSTGSSLPPSGATNDLDSLKSIVTAALKMLYERDSRLHFLPPDFWLMVDRFDKEGFINAVVEEEMAQREAEAQDDSDSEAVSEPEEVVSYLRSRSTSLRTLQHNHKERRLAEMGPKLEVLKHMPFVVPFETRVKIFRKFIQMDRNSREGNSFSFLDPQAKHHARIRRGMLFEDAYNAFFSIGDGLKDLISITFIDKFGAPEAGIDGGGVTKEFLTSVISEAFGAGDEDLQMFTTNSAGLVYPNPTAVDVLREQLRKNGLREGGTEWNDAINELLKRYEFLGRIFGKCMYEGILVDVAFAGFFLLKWPSPGRNEPNTYKGSVNDLRDMDEELYRGLLRLKNHQGDVSELGIDFTITDQVSRPDEPSKTITRNLIPNGDQVLVTNDNRLLYNSYVARHRLVLQPALQTQAFLRGLRAIIKPSWLSMFNQSELQRLEGGDSSEIDVEDLRRNTVYSGLYEIGDDGEEHPTVKLFWKVMAGFTDAQRRDVIKYVSSTPRAPLLGFSQLSPKFSIRDSGRDEDRLPSTSTCVNLLKLPMYTKESTLREKLLYAVTSGAGFDLS
ncbi:hypothetical protein NLU13_9830 [Sarocladium strictum]|uniref:HECT-type E3 ubiquitin transferase n=1 Tax=Sarocladium strictum TaxID=5046 RepID=A0AA39G9Z7_SARSR|nr:hypothetical protein NLU13_9830 [Sarocladium strictum]